MIRLMPNFRFALDGKKLSKWKPRSRRAQFVGWSPSHASSVAWVRNLQTGRASPQFHVTFDNWFETVELDNEEETPPQWDVIVTSSTFMANLDPEDLDGYELDDEWLSKEELLERRANRDEERNRIMQQGVGCRKKKVDPAIAEATAAASKGARDNWNPNQPPLEVADVTTAPAAPISAPVRVSAPARATQVTSRSVAQQQQAESVRRAKRARQLAHGVDNPHLTGEPAWSTSESVVQEAEYNPMHGPSRCNPAPKRRRLTQAERLAQEARNFRPRNSTRRPRCVPPTDAGCAAF